MRNAFRTRLFLSVIALAVALTPLHAFAAKDTLVVTALPSTNPSPTVTPVLVGSGGGSSNYFYIFSSSACIVTRTFPVQFDLNNSDPGYSGGATISFGAGGSLKNYVTLPADFLISEGQSTTKDIVLSTPCLDPGDYNAEVQVAVDPNRYVKIEHAQIHIRLRIGNPGPKCYFTDSSYNLLTDCSGNPVQDNGTFAIVVSARGKVAATNPGQFYYNLIWTNPGPDAQVTINLTKSATLNTKGANSVHALTFGASGFVEDFSSWEMVNQDGTPCGPSGPCTVLVKQGETLWVTWHLEYAGIGGPLPTLAACPGDVAIWATGTLMDGSMQLAQCTAHATGYLKPK